MKSRCTLAVFLAALALTVIAADRSASAQTPVPCDSCATCTAALATPRARAELSADLATAGISPCVVIRGDHALFDGHERSIVGTSTAGSIAVRIAAPGVVVRNIHASRVAVGIEIAGSPSATLFHDTIESTEAGIRVTAADSARISRCTIRGGRVGIAFGELVGDHCPDNVALRSAGAVVHRTRVEGTEVGIAACDALPVLTENTIERNGVGIALGAPSRGTQAGEGSSAPFDACVCTPELDGVRRGTTLLFSSGCGGCLVHEGWLPGLRASGRDIRARETGLANAAAAERFDAYVERCAPEITDSLGIPGCVPNYACPATGATYKVRDGEHGLSFEAQLNSATDVGNFAAACTTAATQNYRAGRSCIRYQLRANSVCGNRTVDIRAPAAARRFGGLDNHCGTTDAWSDTAHAGCTASCTTSPSAASNGPSNDNELMSSVAPTAQAEPPGAEAPNLTIAAAAAPLPPTAQPRPMAPREMTAAEAGWTPSRWLIGGVALFAVAMVARQIRRRRTRT